MSSNFKLQTYAVIRILELQTGRKLDSLSG